jgi:hypothetical protein
LFVDGRRSTEVGDDHLHQRTGPPASIVRAETVAASTLMGDAIWSGDRPRYQAARVVSCSGCLSADGVGPVRRRRRGGLAAAGRERAQRDKVELIWQGKDGQIGGRNSYGHDDRNRKG